MSEKIYCRGCEEEIILDGREDNEKFKKVVSDELKDIYQSLVKEYEKEFSKCVEKDPDPLSLCGGGAIFKYPSIAFIAGRKMGIGEALVVLNEKRV